MKLGRSWLTMLLQTVSALGYLALSSAKTANVDYSAVVNTITGPVRGITLHLHTNKTVTKFLGIPYAQADRFEPPKSPKQWNDTFNATDFGSACPQMQNLDVNASLTSEDCLFINVFVPANETSSKLRAVMVWVHGGGFLLGSGGLRKYDGSFLATEGDVVVVTFNYRLGLLGFLWAEGISRNLGMLDQLQALTWVKDNIQSFGGDPKLVTLFGESAGARSVALHLLSPLTNGLYHRVILESGTVLVPGPSAYSDVTAKRAASAVAGYFDCIDKSQLRACLTNKTTEEIVHAQTFVTGDVIDLHNMQFGPVVDGEYLPDYPAKLLNEGKFNKTDMIIGVNRDEASLWLLPIPALSNGIPGINRGLSKSEFDQIVRNTSWIKYQDSRTADAVIFQYTDWSDPVSPPSVRQQLINLMSDALFKAPTVRSAKIYSGNKLQVYFYSFEHRSNSSKHLPMWAGVYHSAEIGYVFGKPLLDLSSGNTAEVQFSRTIIDFWTNFSKTGIPSKDWPPYNASFPKYAVLDLEYSVKDNLLPDKMAFWNKYLPAQQGVLPFPTPTISTTPPPTCTPGDSVTSASKATVDALIVVTVALIVGLIILTICWCRTRRKLAIALDKPSPSTRLI